MEEAERLLERLTGWSQLALALVIDADLRVGEVRALRVGDLDFASQTIAIRHSLSAGLELPAVRRAAGSPIRMTPRLASWLSEATGTLPAFAYVVSAGRGARLGAASLQAAVRAAARRHRLSYHSPDAFRGIGRPGGSAAVRVATLASDSEPNTDRPSISAEPTDEPRCADRSHDE
jgi:integrase